MAKMKRASTKKRAARKAAAARSNAEVKLQSSTVKVVRVQHLAKPPDFRGHNTDFFLTPRTA
jgi:hypothetical protein